MSLDMATRKAAETKKPSKEAQTKKAAGAGKPAFRKVGAALEAVRAGDVTTTPAALLAFEEAGAGEASVALAVLAAYAGRWDDAIVHAGRAFAKPGEIYAGNVWWDDVQTLLIRAARETGSFDAALAAVPAKASWANGTEIYRGVREKVRAAEKGEPIDGPASAPAPDRYAKYVKEQEADKKWAKSSAGERTRKRFYLAANCGMWDEALAVFESRPGALHYQHVVRLVPTLVARGQGARAWEALLSTLWSWCEVDAAQVTPHELLGDAIWPLMNAERCAQVLATPRGSTAWNAAYGTPKSDS